MTPFASASAIFGPQPRVKAITYLTESGSGSLFPIPIPGGLANAIPCPDEALVIVGDVTFCLFRASVIASLILHEHPGN